ncbi:MAG: lipid-A-disaccharide synthase [Bacteroidales bacterium]|jgi:lipid-A-disaccharide synthase|nr:lipid-A-disaccharide synthase [Bacteroidales bacterium]
MKYFIIAGEASGDMHAAKLIQAIKVQQPEAIFEGWGGNRMENAGCKVLKHYKQLAFLGFWEVFTHLRTIIGFLKECKKNIKAYHPDILITVDYPGFNLRMAKFAKKRGIKTVHYVSPQVWAWKKGRIKHIKKYIDTLLAILPFEKAFYARYNYPVHYVGHPVLDELARFNPEDKQVSDFRTRYGLKQDRPVVAIIPGSREQEIKYMLPVLVRTAKQFPDVQFLVSAVPWLPAKLYQKWTGDIPLVTEGMYPLLYHADAALVTSGTASLETALMNVPQVVGYKGSWLSYRIARWLVKDLKYISLANIILDKPVFREWIQNNCSSTQLTNELKKLLYDKQIIETMKNDYLQLHEILGNGSASERAAQIVIKLNLKAAVSK